MKKALPAVLGLWLQPEIHRLGSLLGSAIRCSFLMRLEEPRMPGLCRPTGSRGSRVWKRSCLRPMTGNRRHAGWLSLMMADSPTRPILAAEPYPDTASVSMDHWDC